jgi:hypothetical protein
MALHVHAVFAFIAERWVKQRVRHISIIGHEQQTRRFLVESPDGKDPPDTRRKQIDDRPPPFVVTNGRDDASWFVQQPIGGPFLEESLAIEADLIDAGVRLVPDTRHPAIDGDPFLGEEALDVTARAESCACQELLQSDRAVAGNRSLGICFPGPAGLGRAGSTLRVASRAGTHAGLGFRFGFRFRFVSRRFTVSHED